MGYCPPPPPVPRSVVEMYRAPRRRLDVSDPATFDRWCVMPAHDLRTLEEFAADGGLPAVPPNGSVGGSYPTGNLGTR